jgi:hypothetical protein
VGEELVLGLEDGQGMDWPSLALAVDRGRRIAERGEGAAAYLEERAYKTIPDQGALYKITTRYFTKTPQFGSRSIVAIQFRGLGAK